MCFTPRQWGIRPRADERKLRVRQAEIEAAEDGLSRSVGLDAAIHWPSDFLMIALPARRLHETAEKVGAQHRLFGVAFERDAANNGN